MRTQKEVNSKMVFKLSKSETEKFWNTMDTSFQQGREKLLNGWHRKSNTKYSKILDGVKYEIQFDEIQN